MQAKDRIEDEFGEPLVDVIAGYAEMKYSRRMVADVLEVSFESLKHFNRRHKIRFARSPIEHREIKGRPPRMVRSAGRTMSLTGWARELGVAPCTIHKRLRTRGCVR